KVFLPNALVGPLDADSIEHRGDVKHSAMAAREIEYGHAIRSKEASAGGESLPRVRQVLEDVVERNDIEALAHRKRIGEQSAIDEVSVAARPQRHGGAGRQARHVEAAVRRRIEEPSMSAAHVEEPSPSGGDDLADAVEHPLEVLSTKLRESGLPAFLVDLR